MTDAGKPSDELSIECWVAESAPINANEQYQSALAELRVRMLRSDSAPTPSTEQKVSIPNYELLQPIGQGGMGTVWKARQLRYITRIVAIKLLRPGFEKHIRRFRQERQALAVLTHPNIAQIFEAGETSTGRPYFAMEYIPGENIADYCQKHDLDLNARLKLFLVVCRAIHHSHSHGLIHRDIKPSNVLVREPETTESSLLGERLNETSVKVIDFGLARYELGDDIRDSHEKTAENTVLGSPFWMSPEQARAAEHPNVPIDRRSDVYSLGALLYQLVTNTPPLSPDLYQSSSQLKILHAIQNQETEPPRRRIKKLGQGRYRTALPPHSVATQFALYDLERVILKALEKEPHRRYQTAAEFSADIQRFIDGQPVLAKSPSTVYRTRKWINRNRVAIPIVTSICILVSCLVVVAIRTSAQASHEKVRSSQAHSQVTLMAGETRLAKRSADRAIRDSIRLKQELSKIDSLFRESLERITPISHGYTSTKKDPEYLLRLSDRLKEIEISDKFRLELGYKIASIWLGYDDVAQAKKVIAQCLDQSSSVEESLESFQAKCLQARCLIELGHKSRGFAQLENSIDQFLKYTEQSTPEIREQQSHLAGLYLQSGRTKLAMQYTQQRLAEIRGAQGPVDKAYLNLLSVLAMAYESMGKVDLAIELCRESLCLEVASLPADLVQIVCGSNLIDIYKNAGRVEEANQLATELLSLSQTRFGDAHPRTIDLRKVQAATGYQCGDKQRSIERLENALRDSSQILGNMHRLTLNINSDLANIMINELRFSEAIELLQDTRHRRREVFGESHPENITTSNLLGTALMSAGDVDQAYQIFSDTFEQGLLQDEFHSARILETVKLLTVLCFGTRREAKAFDVLERFYRYCESDSPTMHTAIVSDCKMFEARMAFNIGDFRRSESICHEALESQVDHSSNLIHTSCILMAEMLVSREKYSEARDYLELVLNAKKSEIEAPSIRVHARVLMAEVLMSEKEFGSATKVLAFVLRQDEISHIYRNYAHSLFGECCLIAGRWKLAEQHLLGAYNNLVLATKDMTLNVWYLPRTARRLERLYQQKGSQKKLQHWRDVAGQHDKHINALFQSHRALVK